jgi:hypothetical protein
MDPLLAVGVFGERLAGGLAFAMDPLLAVGVFWGQNNQLPVDM